MENTPAPAPVTTSSKTTPKDFFLWLGAIIALYGSIVSVITLKFEYINRLFPDALAYYGDPYGGPIRAAMAAVIVLVPTMLVLFWFIRKSITAEGGKANIWVRRWALGLTLFIAVIAGLVDLVTLINTFLGGEITMRFTLKVISVLGVALVAFFYFFADIKGYWVAHPQHARIVAGLVAVGAIVVVAAGFFIIGSPTDIRALRYDEQKVNDLRSIQYQITDYWRFKQELPQSLDTLKDPLSETSIPFDPEINMPYQYEKTGDKSFKLCASFNRDTPDTAGQGGYLDSEITYPSSGGGMDENWKHGVGVVCFDRTIDPDRYGPVDVVKPL
jgi:hypothetical protein